MKTDTIANCKLTISNCKLRTIALIHFAFCILQFSICNAFAFASPTLARLSFWVPPTRMAEFETAYEAKVVPILKKHGLVESVERGRATPDSVFSRLFELRTLAEVEEQQKALQGDSTWTVALRSLVADSSIAGRDTLQFEFRLYAVPAGPGKVVPAGLGKTVPAGPGMGHSRTYDSIDGLVGGGVNSILQDREGVLWFGCGDGISRYDGQNFTAFTTKDGLANNFVSSILQDREGVLWFGTMGGVSRYDGKSFTTFTTQDGLAGNRVYSICQDREGVLWFGGGGGVSRYDGKASSIRSTSLGHAQSFITFTPKDGLAGNRVYSICQDREGNLWFGTENDGVSRYDGHGFTTFTTRDGLADNWVRSIIQDREGNLWFGTENGGVSRYDGKSFTSFTTKDGLANNRVWSIFQDREGTLYFGGRGVSRYNPSGGSGGDGQKFTLLTTEEGQAGGLSIIQDREGNLWFGTAGSVIRYEGKSLTTFTTKDGLADDRVWSIIQDREGNLWFGTADGGLSRYDGKTFTTFTTGDGLASNGVSSIIQDREGNLWFGTENGGVSRYDGKTFTTFTTRDGLADNKVYSIFQDREGVLWFGTTEGGVSRYDGKTFTTFTTRDGLADNNRVYSIIQDRGGNLWFGTLGGVSRYDGKTPSTRSTSSGQAGSELALSETKGQRFTTFTTEDGLVGNGVREIFQDREGHLWFGTSGGMSRYDGKSFQRLTHRDGLAGYWVNLNAMIQDREGQIWVGTGHGVTRYRKPPPTPPPAFIDAVVADRRYEGSSEISISSRVRLTAFEFHGRSFKTRPDGMVYRYRLKGYDKDWKNTHNRRVEYQDLPRGTYTFEVQAVDRDLVYSEKPATVALRVHLPYDRMALLSALGIAVALVAWQTGRVVRRDRRLREANAAMSSANKELFGLNRELQQTLTEKEQAQEMLVRSESMATIGTLVAGVAHEVNNPLGAASSLVQSVQEMIEEDSIEEFQQDRATILDHLSFSRREMNRIKDIVASLLGLSRQTNDYSEPVKLEVVAKDALRVLYNKYKRYEVNVEEAYQEGLPQIQGNFAQLGQVCLNIIQNAIEAVEGKGKIVLKTYGERGSGGAREQRSGEDSHAPLLPGTPAGMGEGYVVFECVDTGPGMSEEVKRDIFKPFFTTKAPGKGTGLGLYLCHQIVEKHKGTIEVDSEAGKGTTFRIKLPVR